jgi:hypothetical protein
MLDRARIRLWKKRSAMRGNHSPRIPWYPDVVSPGARWLVRLPQGSEAAEQTADWDMTLARACESGILTAGWPGPSQAEGTAREPLTRMTRKGIDPCARGTDRTGRPGELTACEPGLLTAHRSDVLCVRLGKADGSDVLRTLR